MEERETKYTIMEGCELPSRGKIYDKPVTAHVELRSMTARDEMKRLSPSSTPLKTLSDIIEGCMIEKPAVHVYDMCLGDYEFLLHRLRIVTYGEKYKLTMRCPECGELIETEADLGSLEIKDFDEAKWNELKTFTLPVSGKTITLKYMTPRLAEEIDAKARDLKRKYKTSSLDFETLVKLTSCVESIDGEVRSSTDTETILSNLPALDFQKVLMNIELLSQAVGIDNTLYLTCPKCDSEVQTFFRFGPEFFRPTNI